MIIQQYLPGLAVKSYAKGRMCMKKKILTILILAVILVMPTVVAVTSYLHAQNNPVTRSSVSQMDVVAPDGKTYSFGKTDKDGRTMFDCFFTMNEESDEVPQLLSPAGDYQVFTASYQSYNKTSEFTYFFTQDPNNAFYRDGNGKYFRIDPKAAGAFLATEYATCLFPSAAQPVLSVGKVQSILPSSHIWKFLGYNDEYFDSAVSTSKDILTCDVTGGLQLNFSVQPDHVFVTIKDPSGKTVHEDAVDKIDSTLFADNILYDVTVFAKWYESEGRTNYGEATYQFKANVLSPAVFYLNTTETEYGDFVIISAKNIVDPTQIGFVAEPQIYFTPVFFEYGGFYHALVPFSMDCQEMNDSADEYSFTLTYGDVDQVLRLNVTERAIKKAYQNISLSKINAYRNASTLAAFDETMRDPLGGRVNDLYWMENNMVTVPVLGRSVKVGYGLKIILENSGESYRHEGVNFGVKANDAVLACLPGKVVFVGETTLSGTTIVVDHGGGLKSLYAHMSSTAAVVGDVVEQGQIIGIVGSTGFTASRTLHFGLYVFDVPVRYYSYEENGINISSAVAEAIGLRPVNPLPET